MLHTLRRLSDEPSAKRLSAVFASEPPSPPPGARSHRLFNASRSSLSPPPHPHTAGEDLAAAVEKIFTDSRVPPQQHSLLICGLSCYQAEKDDLSTADDPHALIGAFARRNYYGEAVARMKLISRKIREKTGTAKSTLRIFCNSRVPEKLTAALAGLGFYGKNSLLIIPGLGSRFILTMLAFPSALLSGADKETGDAVPSSDTHMGRSQPPARPLPDTSPPSGTPLAFSQDPSKIPIRDRIPAPGSRCGTCSACIRACPTGALHVPGQVDTGRCLQELSTKMRVWPEQVKKAWGTRLYGCESCQDVCPYNRGLIHTTECKRGELGPSISLKQLLQLSPVELKVLVKQNPMGLSWINPLALLRNALVAAGNNGNRVLLPPVAPYREHENRVLRDAARWAVSRLSGRL